MTKVWEYDEGHDTRFDAFLDELVMLADPEYWAGGPPVAGRSEKSSEDARAAAQALLDALVEVGFVVREEPSVYQKAARH